MEFVRIYNKCKLIIFLLLLTIIGLFFREQQNAVSENGTNETVVYSYYNKMISDYRENVDSLGSEVSANQVLLKQFRFLAIYEVQLSDTEQSSLYEDYLERFGQFFPEYYEEYIQHLEGEDTYLEQLYKDKEAINEAKTLFIDNLKYSDTYRTYIEEHRDEALKLLDNKLYHGEYNFSRWNILKARYDMEKLLEANPQLGNGKALEKVLGYKTSPYILVIIVFFIVITFFDERKKGLWGMIYHTSGGRIRLVLKRTGILLIISLVTTVVINGMLLALALRLYGGYGDMGQIIQSSKEFQMLPWVISRWLYFGIYCIISGFSLFVVGLCFWLVLSLIKSVNMAMLIAGIGLAVEYALFAYLPSVSMFCVFKYINLFRLIVPSSSFSVYENWGYGSFITDTFTSSELLLFFVWTVLLLALIGINGSTRPVSQTGVIEKLAGYLSERFQMLFEKVPTIIKELYKVLVLQRGILILAIGIYLVLDSSLHRGLEYNGEIAATTAFYNNVEGESPGEKSDHYIAKVQAEYEELKQNFNDTVEEQEKVKAKETLISMMQAANNYLLNIKAKTGIDGVFVNPNSYEEIFGNRLVENQRMVSLVATFVLMLLLSGIFCFEKKQNMIVMIRTSSGRNVVWRQKISIVLFITILVWGILSIINWTNILGLYDLHQLNAPLQSLSAFEKFPFEISILGYLLWINLYRLLLLLCVGVIVMGISLRADQIRTILFSGLMLAPYILYVLGVKVFFNLSLIPALNFNEYWGLFGTNWGRYWNVVAFVLLAIAVYIKTRRKWLHTGGKY